MNIYILNESPHNEEFILEGYATNEAELKQLAENYYQSIYGDFSSIRVEVKLQEKIVEVWDQDNDLCQTFRIHELPRVQVK